MSAPISAAARRLVGCGLTLALSAGCATTGADRSASAARSEVLDAERRFWRAVSRGEVDHALSRFTDQTLLQAPDGTVVQGRVALGERLRRDSAAPLQVLGLPGYAQVDSPDLVVVTGALEWTGATPPPRRGTHYVDTWRWTDAGWRLVSADASPPDGGTEGIDVVKRVLTAWSSGDWDAVQPLLAPGYRARSTSLGAEGADLRQRFDSFHRTWSAARLDIDEQFATGERVVTRLTATLTDARTGRVLRFSGLDVSRVVDGRITEHWDSWDDGR